MTLVHLGENSKLTALPSKRKQVLKFYRDVLGCEQTRKSEGVDIGSDFYLGVVYDEAALSLQDRMKSIWLELETADPDALKPSILDFGIAEIEYCDKEHFYFQAPGGQVFRLAKIIEDMSKWQR
jgi:catechol 2,3-dioxygenase-like lactoylglutathione lyase family enzyme